MFFSGTYVGRHDNMRGAAVHDPCAVMALTHPHLFQRALRHVVVETTGDHTRGMTLIDERRLLEREPPNCEVLTSLDGDAAFDVIVQAIAGFTAPA